MSEDARANQFSNSAEQSEFGGVNSLSGFGAGSVSTDFGRGNISSRFGDGNKPTGFADGKRSTGFGTGNRSSGFGTGNRSSGFGTGNGSSGFGTGNGSSGFGTGNGASGFGTGNGASGFGTGNGSSEFGTGNGASGFGNGNKSSEFGSENEPSGFGTGNGSSGFGTGNRSSGFGTGNGSSGFGTGNRSSGFRSGNGSSGFGTGNGGSGFGNGNKSSEFGSESESSGFGTANGSSGFGTGNRSSGFGSGNKSSGFGTGNKSTENVSSAFGDGNMSPGSRQNHSQSGGPKYIGFGSRNQPLKFGNINDSSAYGNFQNNESFGDRQSRNCFKCNEPGHISRECPKQGGGGDRNCFNCQQSGHQSRDCPEQRKPREERKNGGFGSTFSGNESVYISRNENERDFGSRNESGFGSTTGRRFGEGENEFSGFGSQRDGNNFRDRSSNHCFNCKQDGHHSNDCPEEPRGCFNCGQPGHSARDCQEPRKNVGGSMKARFTPAEESIENIFDLQTIQAGFKFEQFFDADVDVSSGGRKVDIEPVKFFESAGLNEKIYKNVKHAGYERTTPIQQYSIPLIASCNDVMACAQTGSGKTAAFLLPIMTKLINDEDLNTVGENGCYPRCLILTPTRELADQIYNEGRKFAFQTAVEIKAVYGGIAVNYNRSQIERGASIIVGTVGRVKQFIEENIIKLSKIKFFVLDEADRMIEQMGFGNDIRIITNSCDMPTKLHRTTLMFSATFPDMMQEAAREYLKPDYSMITIDKVGAANKCVVQEFCKCEAFEKKDALMKMLGMDMTTYTTKKDNEIFKKKTIVFVSTRSMADVLGGQLSLAKIPSITIHGGREQCERSEAMRLFRTGAKPVLIATAVAERGLDIKGVDHVINYDMPSNIDDYIHRIGRTGRVGNAGRATSLMTQENYALIPQLLKVLVDAGQNVPEWMNPTYGTQQGSVPTATEEEFW